MPTLAFEIGTEEMPANAVQQALDQLRARVEAGLAEVRLAASHVETWGTPRRLIVLARDVPARQPDEERQVRGPSKAIAYGPDGRPTGAAIGFARKQGVPVEALELIATEQGEYVCARVVDAGRPAEEVIGEVLHAATRSLTFPKMMRWGDRGMRFVRPIRWILCMLDDRPAPMSFAGVESGTRSRGHRYLAPAEFDVPHADRLIDALRAAYVEVDAGARRERIRRQADALAAELGGVVPWDEELLDENVWMVEWPTVLRGAFDAAYLELPRPVLVTAMKKHQRFFPVEGPDGALLPAFISVRNGGEDHLDVVREGNERVLAARFADARHFLEQDRATSLDEMAERLDRLVFQEKLGTMANKRARLERVVAELAERVLPSDRRAAAVRAATLCKADLTSQMVIELPALQGTIGREYAVAAGEDPEVCEAIAEHYLPRSAGEAAPRTRLGTLCAIADRVDTLVGYVGQGILPSGSGDPYGLRRAAHTLVQMLAEAEWLPSAHWLQTAALRAYESVNGLEFDAEQLRSDLGTLLGQRIEALLEDRGVRYDLADAALGSALPGAEDVWCCVRRGLALQALRERPDFVLTVQAAARVSNILRAAGIAGVAEPMEGRKAEDVTAELEAVRRQVDAGALAEPSERALFEAAAALAPDVATCTSEGAFERLYGVLAGLGETIDRFFVDVMVMADDAAVRGNRLALLRYVEALYRTLADFTRVVV